MVRFDDEGEILDHFRRLDDLYDAFVAGDYRRAIEVFERRSDRSRSSRSYWLGRLKSTFDDVFPQYAPRYDRDRCCTIPTTAPIERLNGAFASNDRSECTQLESMAELPAGTTTAIVTTADGGRPGASTRPAPGASARSDSGRRPAIGAGYGVPDGYVRVRRTPSETLSVATYDRE